MISEVSVTVTNSFDPAVFGYLWWALVGAVMVIRFGAALDKPPPEDLSVRSDARQGVWIITRFFSLAAWLIGLGLLVWMGRAIAGALP
jgi:hypothetical protein